MTRPHFKVSLVSAIATISLAALFCSAIYAASLGKAIEAVALAGFFAAGT